MPRYRILVEYDGSPFVGWQRQDNGPSVQGAIEEAIRRFAQEEAHVQGAGRTDSGVHALGQVAHFDLVKEVATDTVRDALNFHLKPNPVTIIEAQVAADDFHARFSAKGRSYLYRILNRRAPPTLDRGHVWHVPYRLDASAMHEAAQTLIGNHDFSSFRAADCQAESPVKTLDTLDVSRAGDEIQIRAEARSFLHSQVRIMVGTLKMVGDGHWTAADVARALAAADRTKAGPTAPPDGLYLMRVAY
ncbi:MAG TPA: tRNA pseudouridine(38-40) synthase TruA [Alphaproteobacteria bacterium]|jgi:tRNA pseudouridine38-40 synthase|nr:tRNA pseudouridine(38-40) synthase TruA [Alphaproteobacteria bacterium]